MNLMNHRVMAKFVKNYSQTDMNDKLSESFSRLCILSFAIFILFSLTSCMHKSEEQAQEELQSKTDIEILSDLADACYSKGQLSRILNTPSSQVNDIIEGRITPDSELKSRIREIGYSLYFNKKHILPIAKEYDPSFRWHDRYLCTIKDYPVFSIISIILGLITLILVIIGLPFVGIPVLLYWVVIIVLCINSYRDKGVTDNAKGTDKAEIEQSVNKNY